MPRTPLSPGLVQACFGKAGYAFPGDPGGFISPEDIWADGRVSRLARIR